MRIAVCIKQVPVSEQVEIDANTHQIVRANAEMTNNPADMNALTEAIKLKEQYGATVDVFTMGASGARSALVTAIAMGADEGYLVTDRVFAGGDSLGTAKVLAKAMQSQGDYDLVICGSLSADGATGQVGPMVAELMKLVSVTEVKKILSVNENKELEVYKSWKGKFLYMSVELPAMISISLGSNVPILPTLRNQMKAKKKEMKELTNQDLKISEDETGLKGAKSIVTDTVYIEDNSKRSSFIEGTVEEQAERLIELMKKVGE